VAIFKMQAGVHAKPLPEDHQPTRLVSKQHAGHLTCVFLDSTDIISALSKAA
jgi:hypothetical protein